METAVVLLVRGLCGSDFNLLASAGPIRGPVSPDNGLILDPTGVCNTKTKGLETEPTNNKFFDFLWAQDALMSSEPY